MLLDVVPAYMASVRAPVGTVPVCHCPEPPAPPVTPPFVGPIIQDDAAADPLGAGIIRPFVRTEHQDFASDSGVRLVLSCVEQVLGTPVGTFPWEPAFGSNLFMLRHRSQDPTFLSLAKIYTDDAIRQWEPRAQVVDVEIEQSNTTQANFVSIVVWVKIGGKIFSAAAKI